VTSDQQETNRVLGFSAGAGPGRSRSDYEEQHVLGSPASWFDDINVEPLRWLVHPFQQYRRWARRRRPAPQADEAGERAPGSGR
jgi:hypothetical protein